MRVLHLIDGLGFGGAERSLAELLPGLRAAGADATVVTLKPRPDGVEAELRADGFDIELVRARHLAGRVREVRALIQRERPDIVHTALFDASLAGRLAAVRTPARVMTSLTGMPYTKSRYQEPTTRPIVHRAVQATDGWTARHLTRHFHAVTHAVKDEAIRSLGIRPELVTVVERGRDTDRLGVPSPERRSAARAALGIAPEAAVVLNMARQEHSKGQRDLIEAFAHVAPAHPEALLLVVGRAGAASADLEAAAAATGLGDRIRILGFRSDVPEILAATDVFVLPSLREGIAGAVIEAMALGLPVVASDLETIREVVDAGQSGLLVAPEQPAKLAEAIARMLEDPAWARALGARGRELFNERYTLERAVERMVALYELVLAQ